MRRAGPGDERGRRAIGSLSVLGGCVICAVALDLVPIDESSLHAPRAVLFLAGLVVLVAGVMALGGPDSRHNDLLAAALLLSMAAAAGLYPERYPAHEARALAFQGNAERAAGDFRRGEDLLERAQRAMTEHQVTDLDLVAELHSFLGSLHTDLRGFAEAEQHLAVAARLYQAMDREEELARVAMKLANLHRAREIHREALAALLLLQDAATAHRLTVETLHHVARFLGQAACDPAARFDQNR